MQLSNSIEVDPKDSQKRIKAFRSPTPFYGTSVKKVDIPDFQRLEFLTSLELNGFGISFSLPGFRNLFHLRHVKLVLTVIDFEDMHMDDSNTFRLPHSDSDISISNSPREGFPVLRCLELVNSRSFFFRIQTDCNSASSDQESQHSNADAIDGRGQTGRMSKGLPNIRLWPTILSKKT
jgi:hypothetical protein